MEINLTSLALSVLKAEKTTRCQAFSIAWHIINDYPDALKESAISITHGDVPSINVEGISYSYAHMLACTPYAALELLYILWRDPKSGKAIVTYLGMNDNIKQ